MTESGLGCVSIVNDNMNLLGFFTDGDLRRKLQENGKDLLSKKMGDFDYKTPVSIQGDALLHDAAGIFKKHNVDNLVVLNGETVVGILDIQDVK
jgi:CBS domain-containing protein